MSDKPTNQFNIAHEHADHGRRLNAQTLKWIVRELAIPPYGIERTSVVPLNANRHENDAEHSFALALVATYVAPLVDDALDIGLIARYALVHDLPEIHSGDVSVYADSSEHEKKERREEEARERIRRDFGGTLPGLIRDLYGYKAQSDPESRFVHALDKLLPHVNVLLADHHPIRPTWNAYKRTENVARQKIASSYPDLLPIFEELCEAFEQRPHFFAPAGDRSLLAARDDNCGEGQKPGPGDR